MKTIDTYTFWIFFLGILKDHGADRQNGFYFTFGLLLISLTFEK